MLSTTAHTYGPECSLQPGSNVFTRRASAASVDAPLIRAQFFYSSPLPIDDPLSPVPPPSSKPNAASRVPPRPFSVTDNKALEEAWQSLQKRQSDKHGFGSFRSKRNRSSKATDTTHADVDSSSDSDESQKKHDHSHKHGLSSPQSPNDPHLVLCDHPDHIPFDDTMPIGEDEIRQEELEAGIPKKHRTPFHKQDKAEMGGEDDQNSSPVSVRLSRPFKRASKDTPYGSSPSERDTTGTPFLRVASRLRSRSRHRDVAAADAQRDGAASADEDEIAPDALPGAPPGQSAEAAGPMEPESETGSPIHRSDAMRHRRHSSRKQKPTKHVTVPVGVSRLHKVQMPDLNMSPIYWDPVHDISSVIRGTWFYKESMLPVPSDVANQLEEGYEYMKPWTTTYVDELDSCLEVGAEAETKIVYRLWPESEAATNESRPGTAKSKGAGASSASMGLIVDEKARKAAVEQASKPENRAAGSLEEFKDSIEKKYARYSVIYANAKDAQILRPGLLPSAAKGRKPLGPIRKGRTIGVPVVRGFDYKTWEKLHPSSKKRGAAAEKSKDSFEIVKPARSRAPSITQDRRISCVACMPADERSRPTDLVLVIHGIGQKLSERVESFHFTHAVNAFRRQINVELEAEAVKPWLRQDLGGIMVLPINWRSTLKFEDGHPRSKLNRKDGATSKNDFTLKDITADSIPAVRNLISDVMLDIPYYLSHHKPRMIEAVVREANRVYRLWCKNNPGFAEKGRVHLIAHSLGSVMALDILSKQPTQLPKLDLTDGKPSKETFDFDTKSLFFCGSPAGFFLLLNKAPLLPRRGRGKPDADGEDTKSEVTGEVGTYGCLAVDNLYNVVHYNDPIAYRMNACVDVDYAYSLQPARVPSAASTWGQLISSAFRSKSVAPSVPHLSGSLDMPPRPGVNRMPTTVELETHDFSHEELAEKRMLLLNDNGQIDFTLHSGGGPLEIQYLNMLSAHSSYWILQDFIRFLVIEIGRKPGKESTLPAVRASKKAWGKK
ncbi:MAG: hypothetical protein Q9220_007374 [cf. Caloplaca sp. 1 TL-2023]